MTDKTENPDEPTPGQHTILEGLRRACLATTMPHEPPATMTPGTQIAWYTGVLSAAIDTLAARSDLYAPHELYESGAVTGYAAGLAVLFHAQQPRNGLAYRLTTYCNIVHPAGLDNSVDPATSAIHETMKAAALILHATSTLGTSPTILASELRRARRTLLSATAYANDAAKAATQARADE